MKKKSLFILVFSIAYIGYSQYDQTAFMEKSAIDSSNSQLLYLRIQNQNLIKNNEYFNNITPGYTFAGSMINATLKYFPTENIKMEAGVHLMMNYGHDELSRVLPVFRFQYQFHENFNLVMGTIYGGLNHGLIEPIYRFDRFMEDPPEMGLQLQFRSNILDSDLYLNWRNYLFKDNYSEKEQFTAGWVNTIKIMRPENRFQIHIPIQFIVNHSGSQVDTLTTPDYSIANLYSGIGVIYSFNGFIKETGGQISYVSYRDFSTDKVQKFQSGNALYPILYARSRWFDLYFGYWWGRDFIAPIGEALFSSISYTDESLVFPERQLILFKLNLHHQIANGIFIGGRFESYTDLLGTGNIDKNVKEFNYSYSVYITFDRSFFLGKPGKFE